jgi:hypothetical protein
MARSLNEIRAKIQEQLRDVLLILSNINDMEERISKAKNNTMKLFEELDNAADGETKDQR